MSEALVLEFTGLGLEDYRRVNSLLGLEEGNESGDWPAGLTLHAGGLSDDGLVVIEVWDSREAQAAFMQERLGAALHEAGVTAAPRVTWAALERVEDLS